jgi:Flp pilus assembly pilin Flp
VAGARHAEDAAVMWSWSPVMRDHSFEWRVMGVFGSIEGCSTLDPRRRSIMTEFLQKVQDEAGQTMAEYAVVLGVITIAVVVTLGLLSTKISDVLNSVISSM